MPTPNIMLDLINAARANPEQACRDNYVPDLNDGLPAGSITPGPKVALIEDSILTAAALKHAQWCLDNQVVTHEPPSGGPLARVEAAGYDANEAMENAGFVGTYVYMNTEYCLQRFNALFIQHGGHRYQMLFDGHREMGCGWVTTPSVLMAGMPFAFPGMICVILFAAPEIQVIPMPVVVPGQPPMRAPNRPPLRQALS